MPIELLSDILEEIADRAGVYNACDNSPRRPPDACPCRVCFVSSLEDRIRAAIALETRLASASQPAVRYTG